MESDEYKIGYIHNSQEKAMETSGYPRMIMKKATYHSHCDQPFEKEGKENINYTLRNEDNPQNNIFDQDISINYNTKRHRNLHLKKQISN